MNASAGEASLVVSGARRRTRSEILRRAERGAEGFRALGVGEGETVALLLRNDFAFFEASLAANLAGAYAVPINWHSTAEESGFIIRDCGAKAIIVHEDLLPAARTGIPRGLPVLVAATPPEIANAYRLALPIANAGTDRDWDEWLASHAPIDAPNVASRSAVIYTSGTTGRPKGVRRVATVGPQQSPVIAAAWGLDFPLPMTVLVNGPMYHSAPNSYALMAFRHGADIVLQARFDAEEMLAMIEQYRITHMHIVPTMFVRLLKLPEEIRSKYDLSSLKFVVHGAAPCGAATKQAMIAWWGPVISEYYGSSETGLASGHDSHDALRKPGTVGRPLANVVVKIMGEEGKELGVGEVGDIYIQSGNVPNFTYIGQTEQRAEVGLGDFVTVGDVGWVDEDGFLFLSDRKRDMIISGGVNIYPAEIEAALVGISGVRDCAVFGIPDDDFGEAICAYIQPSDNATLTADAIRTQLAAGLARFKIPKIIEFVSELPREDSGKIFKRKLRDPYWAGKGRSI